MTPEPFPLDEWFDLSKRISREDCELCEAQMALYAHKQGDEPYGKDWRRACQQLRAAVKQHNAGIP